MHNCKFNNETGAIVTRAFIAFRSYFLKRSSDLTVVTA